MAPDRRKASSSSSRTLSLFAGATTLRLLLFFAVPTLSTILGARVEISTPVSGFRRLQEGLFLYTHGVSPYDGGVFHQAPIFLAAFALFPSSPLYFDIATKLLYIGVDLLCAWALMQIAESGLSRQSRLFTSPRRDVFWDANAIGAAYLFNPFTIATCLGRPTSVFTTCAILLAVSKAVRGKPLSAMGALGLAAYLAIYPALLLPPLLLLSIDHDAERIKSTKSVETQSSWRLSMMQIGTFAITIAWLLYISYILTGDSWEFIASTYGVQLLLPDLTPNIGLWWYFFIEMFDSFRAFFLAVFWLHLAGYVAGLTIRLRPQPLFVITTMLGIFAIFKPYPSLADTSLYFAMLPLYRHVFPLMRYTFFAVSALFYATLLGPAFYHLWIYAGSGNANFFYAITLVWSLGLVLILADALFAVLRDEWEVQRPEMKGRDIRQI